jgi:hypothetical protein
MYARKVQRQAGSGSFEFLNSGGLLCYPRRGWCPYSHTDHTSDVLPASRHAMQVAALCAATVAARDTVGYECVKNGRQSLANGTLLAAAGYRLRRGHYHGVSWHHCRVLP